VLHVSVYTTVVRHRWTPFKKKMYDGKMSWGLQDLVNSPVILTLQF
jgi:hypothetical protein